LRQIGNLAELAAFAGGTTQSGRRLGVVE